MRADVTNRQGQIPAAADEPSIIAPTRPARGGPGSVGSDASVMGKNIGPA